ncbi:FKBP-type peptidyl-prolyl cis-trans isomerase [Chitinophaga sp. 30R24]|uniref:FKBP-type peptidyl-prolyl cis-trans isomerase n=1 Tax=Chitinophaga sp. 30R24 TaxID=3248838 RepID=UPI003B8F90DF
MNTVVKLISTCMLLLLAIACAKKDDAIKNIVLADARMDNQIQAYLSAHNETAVRDASGLYYRIVQQGDSIHFVKASSVPSLIYANALLSGEVVGTSFGPTDFDQRKLKNHIPGWQIGLQKISLGGKIRLYIPPALAYGSTGVPGVIPANVVLISDVQLVSIK